MMMMIGDEIDVETHHRKMVKNYNETLRQSIRGLKMEVNIFINTPISIIRLKSTRF